MYEFEKQKIKRNLVTLERYLILNDFYQELSVERKILSQRMLDNIRKYDPPSLDYCMRLLYVAYQMHLLNLLTE